MTEPAALVDPPEGGARDGAQGGAPPGHVVEHRVSPAHRAVPRIGGLRPVAALAIALGMGLAVLVIAVSGHGSARPPSPAAAPLSAAPVASSAVPVPASAPRIVPLSAAASPAPVGVRASEVSLPTLGVRSPLVDLDIGPDGALVPPDDPAVAGWYVHGALPGEPGPTVIAGHVDSRSGPAVFYRLDQLAAGDRVEVTRSDGQVFAYGVITVERFPKDQFPTDRVYGPSPGSELRLITCGGDFDHSIGHYRDNIVVTAVPVV